MNIYINGYFAPFDFLSHADFFHNPRVLACWSCVLYIIASSLFLFNNHNNNHYYSIIMSIKTDLPNESQQQSKDVEMQRPLVNTSSTENSASPHTTPRATHVVTSPSAHSKQEQDSQQAAHSKVISSCLMYSFCSVSMVLTNKSLASR